MSLSFRTCFVSLSLLFALSACESKQDIERKPDVARDMIENSIAKCDTGQVAAEDGAPYAERLRKVLMNTNTRDLETLRDNGYTVALDQRLSKQNTGFWDTDIQGVAYNEGAEKYISIWDDGKIESSFWSKDAYEHGSTTLEDIARDIRDGDEEATSPVSYAGVYSRGKGGTYVDWKTSEDFDQDSQAKNPELRTPPIRVTVSVPAR